jgi:acyl carrier protein
MAKINKITKLIYEVFDEINVQLTNENQLAKSTKTIIFGKDGQLDSLGLVNLVVMIEQNIEDNYDVEITIADERAISQKHSPFSTVRSLADYIELLLREKLND